MPKINIQYYKTNISEFILGSYDNKLCMLDFRYKKMRLSVDTRIKKALKAEFVEQNDDVLDNTKAQLNEYFVGNRKYFNIPLLLVGTEFQKNVWNALINVPYATTSTYMQLAKDINNPKAIRAVASANGANALSIIIPCHRIIGSNGELRGYSGGLSVKNNLLELERLNSNN